MIKWFKNYLFSEKKASSCSSLKQLSLYSLFMRVSKDQQKENSTEDCGKLEKRENPPENGMASLAQLYFLFLYLQFNQESLHFSFSFYKEQRARLLEEDQSTLCATKVSPITDYLILRAFFTDYSMFFSV